MTSDADATRVDSRVGAGADVMPHVVIGATSETPGVSDVASLIASVVIDSGDGDADRWTSTEKRSRRSTICSGAMNGSTICAMNIRAITRLKRGVTVGVAGANTRWVPAMTLSTSVLFARFSSAMFLFLRNFGAGHDAQR